MSLFHKTAGILLRRLQKWSWYRAVLTKLSPPVEIRESAQPDRVVIQAGAVPGGIEEVDRNSKARITEWQAFSRGKRVGSVQLLRIPAGEGVMPGYWLFDLYVSSLQRGRGIGKALSQVAIERARIEGASHLDLLVFEDDIRSVALYQNLDFMIFLHPELTATLEEEHSRCGRRRVVMRKNLTLF